MCFSLAGLIKWTLGAQSQIISSPAIGEDGNVVVGTVNGYVYSIVDDPSAPPCPV